ncbi:MAG: SDR family NAD(P)-dependent oxidoreductase [Acidobacteriota bacterium]
MAHQKRHVALVTGASSGIGAAFAHVLAAEGYALVLTARRPDRLQALARDLEGRHAVRTIVVPGDLAEAGMPGRLVLAAEAAGLPVDLLVNNAGYGVPGRYTSATWEAQHALLRVMVVALAELTHRLLPGMIDRRWGRIINVASLAGLLPGVAGHTLYAASKAFVVAFSESLALEGRPHGVHVTASCPGFTWSEFHDVTGTRERVNRLPAFMWSSAEAVARESYFAVMAGVPVYVPGRVNRTLGSLGRVLPRTWVRGLMSRNSDRFRDV